MNKKIFFSILILVSLFVPTIVFAQFGPLVICGRDVDGNGIVDPQEECTLCDIFRMLQTVLNFIWWILLIIAPLFIIAGGIMILTAGIKPEQVESGKRIITGTLVGLAIALLSWTILNMVFNAIANQGSEGFPWPWNEIRCAGGGVRTSTDTSSYGCVYDTDCPSGQYCDFFSGECVNTNPGIVYCCCNLPDGAYSCSSYSSYSTCQSDCLLNCQSSAPGFTNSCCLNQRGLCGVGPVTGRCGQMSPAGACAFNNNFQCLAGVNDQYSDASVDLLLFLNCMARNLSQDKRIISSLTDNSGGRCFNNWITECTGTTDSCSGTCCGHSANSLHYGGTGCRGTSYAVDIAVLGPDTAISQAAANCATANSLGQVDVVDEVNHIHIELDALARQNRCL